MSDEDPAPPPPSGLNRALWSPVDGQFRVLQDTLFDSLGVAPEESLANLVKLVAWACCFRFKNLCNAESLPSVVGVGLKGLPVLVEQIDHLLSAGAVVGKTLFLERKRMNASAMVRPKPGVKNDVIYKMAGHYMVVLHHMRAKDPMIADMIARNSWPMPDPRIVEKLPPFEENRAVWADMVAEIILNDPREKRSLSPGGDIYEAIKEASMRSRKGKGRRHFQKRYRIAAKDHPQLAAAKGAKSADSKEAKSLFKNSPDAFLMLTHAAMMRVVDFKAGGERLSPAEATRLEARARGIVSMVPTPAELKSGLAEAILNRAK